MTITITRKTKNIEKFIEKVKGVNRKKVSSGYYRNSGKHTSGYTYAHLMSLHEFGLGSFPPRPVRQETIQQIPTMYKHFAEYFRDYFSDRKDLGDTLDCIGKAVTIKAQSIFGSDLLEPNNPDFWGYKGFNAPLVDSGLLKNNWSWKNSVDKKVKNVF